MVVEDEEVVVPSRACRGEYDGVMMEDADAALLREEEGAAASYSGGSNADDGND